MCFVDFVSVDVGRDTAAALMASVHSGPGISGRGAGGRWGPPTCFDLFYRCVIRVGCLLKRGLNRKPPGNPTAQIRQNTGKPFPVLFFVHPLFAVGCRRLLALFGSFRGCQWAHDVLITSVVCRPYRVAFSTICRPHSLASGSSSHHQRPARRSSPGSTARVQGRQPMLGYPLSWSSL